MRRDVAIGLTFVAAFLWGTSFLVNDVGVESTPPAVFSLWRFGIAAIASVLLAVAVRAFQPRIFLDPLVWLLAALNTAAFLLQYVAQTMTTPARTALFVNSNVLVVALLSWIALRAPPRARTLGAMVVAVAGVILLQTRGEVGRLTGSPLGDGLAFLCGTSGAVVFVLFPRALARWNGWSLMAAIFVGTALLTLPVAAATTPAQLVPPAVAWPTVLYAALATSTLAYTLWAFTMHRLSPTTSAVLLLLEVLVAAVISVGIGRELFTPVAAVGAALLLAGVTWLSLSPPDTPAPSTSTA